MPFKSLLRVHRFSFSMVTWTEKGWKPLVYGFRGNVSSSVERFFIWNLMLSPSALLCFDLLCQRKLAKNLESEKFNLKTTFTWIQLWLGFLYFEILVIEVHVIKVPVVEAFLVKVHVGSRCWGVCIWCFHFEVTIAEVFILVEVLVFEILHPVEVLVLEVIAFPLKLHLSHFLACHTYCIYTISQGWHFVF